MATDKLVDFDHVTDYISREAAISEIMSEPTDAHYPSWYAEKLKQIPAADVRPVVHGEWKNAHPSSPMLDGGGPPYCSVCGKEAPLRSVEVNQWKLERGSLSGPEVVYKTECFLSNFCPNCGADMRESNLDTTKGERRDNSSG